MENNRILKPLQKALKFYSVLAVGIVLFQLLGLGMYLVNVWPNIKMEGLWSEQMAVWMSIAFLAALFIGFSRSFVWIKIYWDGSKALSLIRRDTTPERLTDVLRSLTRLLVASCILDVLFLPAWFLSGAAFPFQLAGWRLGAVEVARVLFPQAIGVAALILAFLTHQYGRLVREKHELKNELELTI
jgi:hypothetical protein